MSGPGSVGFFGKLPGMGDFVQRRLPPDFVAVWDKCFQAAIEAARSLFGDVWRAEWPHAPLWRFALAPGVCGTPAWVGVMGPSVDRVGRTFPLVLASAVADRAELLTAVRTGNGWFVELERACRGACGSAPLSVDDFDAVVAGITDPCNWPGVQPGAATAGDWPARDTDSIAWLTVVGNEPVLGSLAEACFGASDGCLWWTPGSWRVTAGARLTHGLPRAADYPAFLGAGARVPAPAVTTGDGARMATVAPADVLADLIPAHAGSVRTDSDDTIPFARHAPVASSTPRPQSTVTGDSGVAVKQVGAATLVVADNGAPDARYRAVTEVLSALAGSQWWEADPVAVRARLLALHPLLKERREDLLDPVPEDGAVIAATVRRGQAEVWWIGTAAAWHWHAGQLRLLAAPSAAEGGHDDVTRPAVPGTASPRPPRGVPGLGTGGEPRCAVATCQLLPGDCLLLLATDTLVALPENVLVAALSGATGVEACARIAAAAGLGGERVRWPLAVIEVGT